MNETGIPMRLAGAKDVGVNPVVDARVRQPDYRVTSLVINNLPVYVVGEVLELIREHFGENGLEINISVQP